MDCTSRFLNNGKSSHGPDVRYLMCPEQIKTVEQKNGSLIIEGWASTNALDAYNEIVEPSAFESSLDSFLQRPILLAMHDWYGIPIGKVLEASIKPQGLWVKARVLPTDLGKDIILLIKEGVIRSFSVGFRLKRYEDDVDTGIRHILDVQLLEISVVNVPANPFADFSEARNLKLEIEKKLNDLRNEQSFSQGMKRGGNKMSSYKDKDDVSVEALHGEIERIKATVAQVKGEMDEVGKLGAEMKAFKESSARSVSEQKEFVQKFAGDFQGAINSLSEAIKDITRRNISYGVAKDNPYSVKQLLEKPIAQAKKIFSPEKFSQVAELHRMNDAIMIVDAIKCAADKNGAWTQQPREERLRSLKIYKDWDMICKAFDTATSNEGSQYLPTGYSSELIDMVRLDLVVAGMHPSFVMTNASQYLPVEGADTLATRATQTTTVVSSFNTTEQTPGSANVLFTAEKLRGRTQFSGEAEEDLIISSIDYIRRKIARSIARSIEKATISGDDGGSGYDTGDTPGSTDARYCWNGYRGILNLSGYLNSTNNVDLSTFSESNVNKVRKHLGKYGRAEDIFWLTSIGTYLLHCLDPNEMPSFRTIDKYGPAATVVAGELGKINGSPLLQSEFVLDTYNASGIYDGTTTNKSILLCVNRSAFWYGNYKGVNLEFIRNALDDVYDIVAYQRLDFKNVFAATEDVVAEGYNISTS